MHITDKISSMDALATDQYRLQRTSHVTDKYRLSRHIAICEVYCDNENSRLLVSTAQMAEW